jgi:hypothetical protein
MTSAVFSQSQCYACVLYASAKLVGGIDRSRQLFSRGLLLRGLLLLFVGGTVHNLCIEIKLIYFVPFSLPIRFG